MTRIGLHMLILALAAASFVFASQPAAAQQQSNTAGGTTQGTGTKYGGTNKSCDTHQHHGY